jgi:hypothetical protein
MAASSVLSGKSAAYRAAWSDLNSCEARLDLGRAERKWSPWRRALRPTRFLPCGVRGPVDFCALARLAASKAGVRMGDLRSAVTLYLQEKDHNTQLHIVNM